MRDVFLLAEIESGFKWDRACVAVHKKLWALGLGWMALYERIGCQRSDCIDLNSLTTLYGNHEMRVHFDDVIPAAPPFSIKTECGESEVRSQHLQPAGPRPQDAECRSG